MSQFLSMFNSAGPQAFSQMACQVAPYFSTINPLVTELRANAATVQVPFRREITNHLGTVHAIAMCNAAELAAGMMTDVSIPAGARWIPKGMTVEYLKKAVGTQHAVATPEFPPYESAEAYELPINVVVSDPQNDAVFKARILMWVTPKPARAAR